MSFEEPPTPVTRITASQFQKAFGAMSDKALREPVAITKQGRDHLVVISAERYAFLQQASRKARLTTSLTGHERKLALAAKVPSKAEQKRYLAELAEAWPVSAGSRQKT